MADNAQKRPSDLGIEYGDSGVRIFNGVIVSDDYRPELTGRQLMMTVEEMRRGDATVMAGLNAVKMPIVSAEWFVDNVGETDQEKQAAELVKHNFDSILNWKHTLQEILTMLEFGFSVFELVTDIAVVNGIERIVVTKIAYRKQTTIYSWEMQDGQPGITQFTSHGEMVSIPAEKLVTFTHQQEGDNWQGISILRSAYQNWYYKKSLYQIDAVGIERQSLGVVKIQYPKGATDSMRQEARNAASNIRANERAYIEQPDGWVIDFMDMKANTLKSPVESIAHHDRQILKSMAVQYLEIGGMRSSGSRSSSQDQRRLLELQDQAIAYQIAARVSEAIVKLIVDLNFNLDTYPTWNVDKIAENSIVDLATAAVAMVGANLLTPTDEDEEHIRKIMQFPDIPEDVLERDRAVAPKPSPIATGKAKDQLGKEVSDENNPLTASQLVSTAQQLRAALTDSLYGTREAA